MNWMIKISNLLLTHLSWFNHLLCFLVVDFYGIVFEHLHDCFHSKDLQVCFTSYFKLCLHIAHGHIHQCIAHV
jgi:hypothetical protein